MPAHASTYSNGCTVTPLTPYWNGGFSPTGARLINFDVSMTCVALRTVVVSQEALEDDLLTPSDLLGTATLKTSFLGSGGTVTRTLVLAAPNTDPAPDVLEEVYQRVAFTVVGGGVVSPRTPWERTAVLVTPEG